MSRLIILLAIPLLFLCHGCAMFQAWQSIPPPGGCDQCHVVPISHNWQASYKAPVLTDERNREHFQTAEYTMAQPAKPTSTLDLKKVEELKCFECHKSPNEAHKIRAGRFHH